jgi:hypothetical protein
MIDLIKVKLWKWIRLSELLIIAVSILSCGNDEVSVCCSCREKAGLVSPYLYPQVDKQLPINERIARAQIPDKVLSGMCTPDLIESYLTYPFINSILLSNNVKSTFQSELDSFNGGRELFRRDDAFTQLIKRYDANNFSNFDSTWTTEKKVSYKANLLILDVTLSQNQILNSASIESKNELLKSAMIVYKRRQLNPELFSINNTSNDFLIVNVLFSTDYLPFVQFVSSHPNFEKMVGGYMATAQTADEQSEFRRHFDNYLKTLNK